MRPHRHLGLPTLLAAALLLAAGACDFSVTSPIERDPVTSTGGPTPRTDGSTAPTPTAPSPTRPDSSAGGLRILVDASRDGGVWWYPQAGTFDTAAYHQGQALADHLRGRGHAVDELPRGVTITPGLLAPYQVVLRAGYFGTRYTAGELAEYEAFLGAGGTLWLVSDHSSWGDALAERLGVPMSGSHFGPATYFAAHPITEGVTSHPYIAGGALIGAIPGAVPEGITALAWLDAARTLAIMGTKALPKGKLFFLGDLNGLEMVPQPLVENLVAWSR